MSSPLAAANAYGAALRLAQPSDGLSPGAGALAAPGLGAGSTQPSFGGALTSSLTGALSGVSELSRRGDAATNGVVSGQANLVEVVTAVAESEAAIETLVAVRDKVITAYEEIMRMPI